jgi:hypothetical protein
MTELPYNGCWGLLYITNVTEGETNTTNRITTTMLLKVQLLTPTNHVHNNHSPLSFFLNQWHTYQFACLSYDFNMTDHNQVVSFSNAICTVYSTDNVCRPNNNLKTQETEIQMLTNLKRKATVKRRDSIKKIKEFNWTKKDNRENINNSIEIHWIDQDQAQLHRKLSTLSNTLILYSSL